MKGKSRNIIIFGGALVLVLVMAGIVISMFYFIRKPNFDSLLPAASSPIQVQLFSPGDGGSFPADASIPVQAMTESGHPVDHVELWINGQLFGTQKASAAGTNRLLAQWHWQPGVEGSYSLMARAIDTAGLAGVSNVAMIQVTQAAGFSELITTQAGDTLASLAAHYGITPQAIQQANPPLNGTGGGGPGGPILNGIMPLAKIDINLPLPPKTMIFIPHRTIPIVGQDFSLGKLGNPVSAGISSSGPLPAFPTKTISPGPTQTVSPAPTGTPSAGSKLSVLLKAPSFFDKLSFQLGSSLHSDPNAPAAPLALRDDMQWDQDKCLPVLWVDPKSSDEDGYFVYRNGQRIGTLPKDPIPGAGFDFHDFDKITGVFTYTVAAYNTAGENYSNPVTFDLSQCTYGPGQFASNQSSTGGVSIQNGVLTLPFAVDLAYLYVDINNGAHIERIPSGSSNFLSHSGYQFDLNNYLGSLIGQIQDADLEVNIQVWGWQGGQVNEVGTYTATLHRTVLAICSREGKNECLGAQGPVRPAWTDEVGLSSSLPLEDQVYDLFVSQSPAMKGEALIYQVSYKPYTDSGCEGTNGIFLSYAADPANPPDQFAMEDYYYDLQPGQPVQETFDGNCHFASPILKQVFPPGTPFSLYVRLIPEDRQGDSELPSNTVVLNYMTTPGSPEASYPLASNLPSLYTVQILKNDPSHPYQPPVFIDKALWGCVTVISTGERDCPPPPDTSSHNWDAAWLAEGEANEIATGVNDLTALYDDAKDDIVSDVAGAIGSACGDDCKSVITGVLDYGITALTGLPPALPNFDDLAAQGIAYTADQIQSSLTGYQCGETCTDAVKSKLSQLVQEAQQLESEPSCTADQNVANYFNVVPGSCPPPGEAVKPVPGGSNQPGVIFVQVTRNSTPAPSGDLQQQYFLDVDNQGYNTTRQNEYGNDCEYDPDGYQPTDPSQYYLDTGTYLFTPDSEHGELYTKVRIPMPLLNPGDSAVIPIPLQPFGHDNTQGYMPDVGCDGFANFKYLFYKGTSTIRATEFCHVAENNTDVPCTNGGADAFIMNNPLDPSDQWTQP